MKKLFVIALAFLICVVMTGCAVEKVAPVSAPTVIDSEFAWNDDEVDAQIPEEYLSDGDDDWDDDAWDDDAWAEGDWDEGDGDEEWDWDADWDEADGEEYDDEYLDYGIPRTLTPAADGTLVDGNPVDYVISDELFSSQMDEISYYPDEYVGKRFAVIGYVMHADEPGDESGFAVVRDYQEPHSDDEDYEDDGEYMTAEEFAALIESMGGSVVEEDTAENAEGDATPAETLEPGATAAPEATVAPEPVATADPGATAAPFAGIEVQPGESVSLSDVAASLPELGAQISIEADPGTGYEDVTDHDEDEEDHEEDHEHEIYPVGIDCYFEGEIPQADAWVRVVGTLEEYDYYDAEVGESFPALRLNVQSVTPIPETEGGSRLVTQ